MNISVKLTRVEMWKKRGAKQTRTDLMKMVIIFRLKSTTITAHKRETQSLLGIAFGTQNKLNAQNTSTENATG